jgi:hypothetical protein
MTRSNGRFWVVAFVVATLIGLPAATVVGAIPAAASPPTPVPALGPGSLAVGGAQTCAVRVKVGPDGKVNLYNQTGTAHVLFDVVGWFS